MKTDSGGFGLRSGPGDLSRQRQKSTLGRNMIGKLTEHSV